MATYQFETRGGIDLGGGPIVCEIEGLAAARHEALLFLIEMLRGRLDEFWSAGEASVTVKTEAGLVLFTLDLTALVAPAMPSLN